MKRLSVYIGCLILILPAVINGMDNQATPLVIQTTPPATPKTPKNPVPTTPRDCACAILARKEVCKRCYDDADHPILSPKKETAQALVIQSADTK
jgi:hypothetical protein